MKHSDTWDPTKWFRPIEKYQSATRSGEKFDQRLQGKGIALE